MGSISATRYIYNEADLSHVSTCCLQYHPAYRSLLVIHKRAMVMTAPIPASQPHSLTSFGIFLMLHHLISQSLLTTSISIVFAFTHACRTPRSPKTSSAPPRIASNF
jgi:hypothetical protein